MREPPTMTEVLNEKRPNRMRRGAPWIALAVEALLAPLVYMFVKAIAPEPEGCTGIGFGCSLAPADVAVIATFLYGVGIGLMAVVVGALELLGAKAQNGRNAVVIFGSFLLMLFVLSAGG